MSASLAPQHTDATPGDQSSPAAALHRAFAVIFRFTRKRRMLHFARLVQPTGATRVLDVGGSPFNWQFLRCRPRVTLLNILPVENPDRGGQFEYVQGDARQLQYADGAFDVAHSNSVIEHVGDWSSQQRFADEIRRVGRQVWVQTPARVFPVEPHYLTPFVHWLPKSWQRRLLRRCSLWGWLTKPNQAQVDAMVDEIRLLSHAEMRRLFPDCQIVVERWLLWPKSYIAVRTENVRAGK